ncbi:MAG TPA: hypothetical protein VEK76_07865 [Candidatus Binatia bacterium]|nr:hypothetical protein [Candidatus Binatia bacterium]
MAADWLSRLERSGRFAPLAPEDERPRPLSRLSGLAGAAVPEAIRRNHGWSSIIPSDQPASLRRPRPGDFFRCE